MRGATRIRRGTFARAARPPAQSTLAQPGPLRHRAANASSCQSSLFRPQEPSASRKAPPKNQGQDPRVSGLPFGGKGLGGAPGFPSSLAAPFRSGSNPGDRVETTWVALHDNLCHELVRVGAKTTRLFLGPPEGLLRLGGRLHWAVLEGWAAPPGKWHPPHDLEAWKLGPCSPLERCSGAGRIPERRGRSTWPPAGKLLSNHLCILLQPPRRPAFLAFCCHRPILWQPKPQANGTHPSSVLSEDVVISPRTLMG